MQEDRPHLALDRPELTGVILHVFGLPLIDGGHGHKNFFYLKKFL